jgi:hypothetical protein
MAVPKSKILKSIKKVNINNFIKQKLIKKQIILKNFNNYQNFLVANRFCSSCSKNSYILKTICLDCLYKKRFSMKKKILKNFYNK